MRKINLKRILFAGCWLLVVGILIYTRFVGLDWGLPYPMHPDERNMANALQQLNCKVTSYELRVTNLKNCFNPHFFAYGQFPLYLGYIMIQIYHLLTHQFGQPINFIEAVMSLRLISAVASVINVFILIKIIFLIINSKFNGFGSAHHCPEQGRTDKIQNSKIQVKNKKFTTFDFYPVILTFAFLLFTFSSYMIQFSHFGTTESLLMLLYSLIIFLSLKLLSNLNYRFLILNSLVSGLAIATKVSSLVFLAVPITVITIKIFSKPKQNLIKKIGIFLLTTGYFLLATLFFSIVFSPHNLIDFNDFLGAMRYESDVALGRYVTFYTRQFVDTVPVIFQMVKIFPYALGWPQFILAILGFFLLPWKHSQQVARISGIPTAPSTVRYLAARSRGVLIERALAGKKSVTESVENNYQMINFLRFAFLIYFLPSSLIFAKWTRFMTPIFPITSVFAILFLFTLLKRCLSISWIKSKGKIQKAKIPARNATHSVAGGQLKNKKYHTFDFYLVILTFAFLLLTLVLPGISYLSIYQSPDVRFQASDWIFKNIPNNSYLLFETANVVDVPIPSPKQYSNITMEQLNNYHLASFNFYDLDTNPALQLDLKKYLEKADYIIIPSRRIYANNTCVQINRKTENRKSDNQFSDLSDFRFQSSDLSDKHCQYLQSKYPLLNKYYDDLISGRLGFEKVAEFSSFPQLKLQVASYKLQVEFPDEDAEETWTVFDHPVIRIFKKNPDKSEILNPKSQINSKYQNLNNQFQNYQTTNYLLRPNPYFLTPNPYTLLIADNPQKWEKGLMNVRSKEELGGADGMIFLFPDKQNRTFWNKNTLVDLDIYWLDGDQLVGKNFLPSIDKTEEITTISSPGPVDKVVELIAGN